MQDLSDLYYFVKVVEHGGYAAAGRSIGMPRSKLSRRVIDLENRLGARLLQRSTRKLTATDIGQEYHRHCVAMLVKASAAQEAIERSRSSAQGRVRISGPPAPICFEVGDDRALHGGEPARDGGAGIDLVPADPGHLPSLDIGPPLPERVWELHS
jgi:hypothetical protein